MAMGRYCPIVADWNGTPSSLFPDAATFVPVHRTPPGLVHAVSRLRPLPQTQGDAHEVEHLMGLMRLLDDREHAGSASAVPDGGVNPAAEDDDRKHGAVAPHGFKELDAAYSRHMNIDDQAIALGGPIGSEKLPTRCELSRLKAFAFEQEPQRVPYSRVIVYDENHRSLFRPALSARFSLDNTPPR